MSVLSPMAFAFHAFLLGCSSIFFAASETVTTGLEEKVLSDYLDRPRLHFSGLFRADVPTVNNIYENLNNDEFSPLLQVDPARARFNPRGTGSFSFYRCRVTSTCGKVYSSETCTSADPVIGLPITTSGGKMVDLDQESQTVSSLIGMRVAIGSYIANPPILLGNMVTAAVTDVWPMQPFTPGKQPLYNERLELLAGRYQSELTEIQWNNAATRRSPFLQELQKTSPNSLSIAFILYAFDARLKGNWTYGRIIGTISPGKASVSLSYSRLLTGQQFSNVQSVFYKAFFQVSAESFFTVDLSNALGRQGRDKDYTYRTDRLCKKMCFKTMQSKTYLGKVEIVESLGNLYGGICDILLPGISAETAIKSERVFAYDCNNASRIVMTETEVYVRPTFSVAQWMDAGEEKTFPFIVLRRGIPYSECKLNFSVRLFDTNILNSEKRLRALTALSIKNKNSSYLTDSNGVVSITLAAKDPGNPRGFVDGCVYAVNCLITHPGNITTIGAATFVKVFNNFTWKGKASWYGESGVHDIFCQYDNLYPVMRRVLVLSDYNSVIKPQNIYYIRHVLTLPFHHSGYMPVTRDLSKPKKRMILEWLNQKYPPKKGWLRPLTLEELKKSLQLAIEIEHSTIPMYLYAMYSVKQDSNEGVRETLREIAMEEMVHMALAANILIALNGTPKFTKPKFIPNYPGPLPGGLHPGLTLRLSKLTKNLIRDVFMPVETPQYVEDENDEQYNNTIGGFYLHIRQSLKRLENQAKAQNKTIFTGNRSHQVDYKLPGDLRISPVYDLPSARQAVHDIIRQGEGCSEVNPFNEKGSLSHYYRFGEILYGKRLIRVANGTWDYQGSPVPFDSEGIYPLPDNPHVTDYLPQSHVVIRGFAEDFGQNYLDILASLQETFEGNPEKLLSSFGLMFHLAIQAKALVMIPLSEKLNAGPTFDNPRFLFSPVFYEKHCLRMNCLRQTYYYKKEVCSPIGCY